MVGQHPSSPTLNSTVAWSPDARYRLHDPILDSGCVLATGVGRFRPLRMTLGTFDRRQLRSDPLVCALEALIRDDVAEHESSTIGIG